MTAKNRLEQVLGSKVSNEESKDPVKNGVLIHFDNKDDEYETDKAEGDDVESLVKDLISKVNEKISDDDIELKYLSVGD